MKLNINFDGNEQKIIISFGKEFLEVFVKEEDISKNTSWNTHEINSFLIRLSSSTPENEKIEIIYDETKDNKIYKHIVNLFTYFVNEYNNNLD